MTQIYKIQQSLSLQKKVFSSIAYRGIYKIIIRRVYYLYITMISCTYHQGIRWITCHSNNFSIVATAPPFGLIQVTTSAHPGLEIKPLNPTTWCPQNSKVSTCTDGASLKNSFKRLSDTSKKTARDGGQRPSWEVERSMVNGGIQIWISATDWSIRTDLVCCCCD